jgi:hypothetical protein
VSTRHYCKNIDLLFAIIVVLIGIGVTIGGIVHVVYYLDSLPRSNIPASYPDNKEPVAQSSEAAEKPLDMSEQKLTPEQISRAQKAAAER